MPSEAGFSLNHRAANGAQITVRGDDWISFVGNLKAALGDREADDISNAYLDVLRSAFPGAGGNVQAPPSVVTTSEEEAQAVSTLRDAGLIKSEPWDVQPAEPAASQPPVCFHGPRTYRSGTGKNGKPWQAWMCPSPKGTPGQCEPEWIR
jgi:hypothetical protein